MHTEFRLKQILDAAGMDAHGRIQTIAKGANINRHTARKIYNNEAAVFSLDTVTRICDWLVRIRHGDGLPGSLFAARPAELLQAICEKRLVTFYLGATRGGRAQRFARAWVARDDAECAARLVQHLSVPQPLESASAPDGVGFNYVYLPCRSEDADSRKRDQDAAKRAFRAMRKTRKQETPVMVGSQRASYLLEMFAADIFRAEPWSGEPGRVPLYLKYHDHEDLQSCFGGYDAPPWDPDGDRPGIYFKHHDEDTWNFFESIDRRQGVGVVIVRRDPGLGRIEVAVFGLSGIATAAMGKFLTEIPRSFWPTGGVQAGLEIGVFVCRFTLGDMSADDLDVDEIRLGAPVIVEVRVDVPGKIPPVRDSG
jgi:hypothetical protein